MDREMREEADNDDEEDEDERREEDEDEHRVEDKDDCREGNGVGKEGGPGEDQLQNQMEIN